MFCPKCGTQNPDGTQFCGNCGTPLAAAPRPAAQQPYQSQQPPSSFQPRPAGAPFSVPSASAGAWPVPAMGAVGCAVVAFLLSLLPCMSMSVTGMDLSYLGSSVSAILEIFNGWSLPAASASFSSLISAMGGMGASMDEGAGLANIACTITFVLWMASLALTAIAAHDAVKTKGSSLQLLSAAGVATILCNLIWLLFTGAIASEMGSNEYLSFGASWSVWVALLLGVAAVVLPQLAKRGIVR